MKRLVLGLALLLGGCASISGTEAGGVIQGYSGTKSDVAKADAYCRQFGKVARITHQDYVFSSATFDCVAK